MRGIGIDVDFINQAGDRQPKRTEENKIEVSWRKLQSELKARDNLQFSIHQLALRAAALSNWSYHCTYLKAKKKKIKVTITK